MSLIVIANLLLLPAASLVLGGGLGIMWSAGALARELGLSLPRVMRLMWERMLDTLPVESGDAASTSVPATRPANALPAWIDRWLVGWVRTHILRQPIAPGTFPVTILFLDLLRILGVVWLALVVYALIRVWRG